MSEGRRAARVSTFSCACGLFGFEDGLARLPLVTDSYGSSLKELACSPRQKNEEAPGPRCARRSPFCKMAGDVRVVRLICSSGRRAEGCGDHRPDQTRLADSGRAAIGFGANLKIPVYASRPDLFYIVWLIIIFNLTTCPAGLV